MAVCNDRLGYLDHDSRPVLLTVNSQDSPGNHTSCGVHRAQLAENSTGERAMAASGELALYLLYVYIAMTRPGFRLFSTILVQRPRENR